MSFTPPREILERYADVLINFALGGGAGVQPGEVVRITAHEIAKPLYVELHRAVWRAGGHAIGHYLPNDDADANLPRDFFELASDEQLDFLPATYMRGLVDQLDHQVSVLSDTDMHALEGIDPARIMRHGRSLKPYMDWRTEKENAGHFTWTLGLYGTPAMAAEAGLSRARSTGSRSSTRASSTRPTRSRAGARSPSRSTTTSTASTRCRSSACTSSARTSTCASRSASGAAGSAAAGRNIPSFEIFTSPDWRGTEGWIAFNQPLYRYGNLVRGIRLRVQRRPCDGAPAPSRTSRSSPRWSRPRTPTRWGSSR